jgi:hypothetical protein
MRLKAMIVEQDMMLRKKMKGWLRELSIPDLDEGILSTLVLPSTSHTSHYGTL